MNENIIRSERSRLEKNTYDSIYRKNPEEANLQRRKIISWLGWKKGEWGMAANECRVSFGGDESVLELDSGDGHTAL